MKQALAMVVALVIFVSTGFADDTAELGKLVAQLSDADAQRREAAEEELEMLPTRLIPSLTEQVEKINTPTARQLGELAVKRLRGREARDKIRLNYKSVEVWWKKVTCDPYEANEGRERKAEKDARPALVAMASIQHSHTDDQDLQQEIFDLTHYARYKGCRDPLVLFAYAWVRSMYRSEKPEALAQYFVDAARAATEENISPYWRCLVLQRGASWYTTLTRKPTAEQIAEQAKWLNEATELVPKVVSDPEIPRQAVLYLLESFRITSTTLTGDPREYANPAFLLMEKASKDQSGLLTARADFNVTYAWHARGGGFADSVTPDGWKLFGERLKIAEECATKAWELDPTNALAANEMLIIEKGQGNDHARMEQWFKRAMEADPDNIEACSRKLDYLQPKWHGSHEQMLKFGRECLQEGNFEGGIPLMVATVHWNLSWRYDPQQDKMVPVEGYYKSDPQIWKDIDTAYRGVLRWRPKSLNHRAKYIDYAIKCEKWDVVDAELQKLPNKRPYSVWGKEKFDEIKRASDERRREKTDL